MMQTLKLWQMNWLALAAMIMLCITYGRIIGFRKNRQGVCFAAAIFLMIVCFFSPLHLLAMHYLFSAHMVVHVVLLLLAGPLLMLSIPEEYDGFASGPLRKVCNTIKAHPLIAWITGIGVMWFWHIPSLFVMMTGHGSVGSFFHALQSISLITAGFIFSMPVLNPYKRFRLHPLVGVVYLFTACSFCSLLGLWITFAPAGTFPHYLSATDPTGLNAIIRDEWGINQRADQQAAGLIMWVPCCMVYVSGAMFLLWRWFTEPEVVKKPNPTISANIKIKANEF